MRGTTGSAIASELSLLIEDAEARGLPVARIELGGRTLRDGRLSRLNLRERQIELRAVAHALFDDRQDGRAGQIGQQALERNHARGDLSGFCVRGEIFERDSVIGREFSHGGASDFGEVRAGAVECPMSCASERM